MSKKQSKQSLEDYFKEVKTGQDLIDLNVIPKDSSSHMALITYKRMQTIREHLLSSVNEDILGKWLPAVEVNNDYIEELVATYGKEITDSDTILEVAKKGMRVVGTEHYDKADLTDMLGTVRREKKKGTLGIEFDEKHEHFHKLDGLCERGYGYNVKPAALKLLLTERRAEYNDFYLRKGVVADKQLGHKVRFSKDYEGYLRDDNNRKLEGNIPKGIIATLLNYDDNNKTMFIKTEENISGQGNRNYFWIKAKDAFENLQSSSLGQIIPKDQEKEVRKETLLQFFPKIVMDVETSEDIILALLMGSDSLVYGAPGGGKSQVAEDITEIAAQQNTIFVVKDCQAQCNPYSLFDEDFAKEVPPCPECKIKYDDKFRETGFFNRPEAKDIEVTVAKYGPSKGIEMTEGTSIMNRMHLTGYKIPSSDESGGKVGGEHDYDPEGFRPGVLIRTNNGVLFMEELDKLRPHARDNLLEALSNEKVKPDDLRFKYPSHQLIIATANDHTVFSNPLNDRMVYIKIDYPEDSDVSNRITRSTYYKEHGESEDFEVGNTHLDEPFNLRQIPIAAPLGMALESFYIKFRKEFGPAQKNVIMGSRRSSYHALDATRAKWFLDHLFFEDADEMITPEYVMGGIEFAVSTRVCDSNSSKEAEIKRDIKQYVHENFPQVLKQEEDTWWCRLYQHIAVMKSQILEVDGNFVDEIANYKENPEEAMNTFNAVCEAYTNLTDDSLQYDRIRFPFMDYLYKEQPNFCKINPENVKGLVKYLIKCGEGVNCDEVDIS